MSTEKNYREEADLTHNDLATIGKALVSGIAHQDKSNISIKTEYQQKLEKYENYKKNLDKSKRTISSIDISKLTGYIVKDKIKSILNPKYLPDIDKLLKDATQETIKLWNNLKPVYLQEEKIEQDVVNNPTAYQTKEAYISILVVNIKNQIQGKLKKNPNIPYNPSEIWINDKLEDFFVNKKFTITANYKENVYIAPAPPIEDKITIIEDIHPKKIETPSDTIKVRASSNFHEVLLRKTGRNTGLDDEDNSWDDESSEEKENSVNAKANTITAQTQNIVSRISPLLPKVLPTDLEKKEEIITSPTVSTDPNLTMTLDEMDKLIEELASPQSKHDAQKMDDHARMSMVEEADKILLEKELIQSPPKYHRINRILYGIEQSPVPVVINNAKKIIDDFINNPSDEEELDSSSEEDDKSPIKPRIPDFNFKKAGIISRFFSSFLSSNEKRFLAGLLKKHGAEISLGTEKLITGIPFMACTGTATGLSTFMLITGTSFGFAFLTTPILIGIIAASATLTAISFMTNVSACIDKASMPKSSELIPDDQLKEFGQQDLKQIVKTLGKYHFDISEAEEHKATFLKQYIIQAKNDNGIAA